MLQKSASTKYLSLLLDNKLNWMDHINKTVEKTNNRLGLMKSVAGTMWESTQDILNFNYNNYVKPIMKYSIEVIDISNNAKLNHLETAQNNALSLICAAVKKTPVTALQMYTENLPISLEIIIIKKNSNFLHKTTSFFPDKLD